MVIRVTQLVFATTEEVNSGGRDNEGDAHSAAGGSGNNNGVTAGVGNEDVAVFGDAKKFDFTCGVANVESKV